MTRIAIPASIEAAPAAARPALEQVKSQLGSVPNLFRLVANSPVALEGWLGLSGALGKGQLPAATRERIALALAEFNGCGYCLSAHTYVASHVAGLSAQEISANRMGRSTDAKADAAVAFALRVAETRGHVTDADVKTLRDAGYDDGQLIEIVQHVALNIWTNYMNEVAKTEIDFPLAEGVAA
ncbi:carboxymuconolactone decarboxylase family protein [Marinibacterium profundimaris]|uniref:Alkylhydroperoxidase n=1 Tax=Marinibacterium profundimaris TaxID=1679460 RepID=A0A225NZU0_9RHOB|nr:carboxymuconolactone decarboxylase family protein [Marinibacterium profundimaris]OWU77586.1 alkylhydroperoxidase [Marinibacterium profundimaris]